MNILKLSLIFLFCIYSLNLKTAKCFYSAFASPTVSTSLTAYSVGSSMVSVYYMISQTKRGPIGKILSSIYLQVQKDVSGEYYFNIRTEEWDGDTVMVSSCILYYFSLAVNPELNDKYNIYSSSAMPVLPWGEIRLNEEPLEAMTRIYNYIASLKGGYIRIALNNVDIWQLYFLAVITKYTSMRNKKFKFKAKFQKSKKARNKFKANGGYTNNVININLASLEDKSFNDTKNGGDSAKENDSNKTIDMQCTSSVNNGTVVPLTTNRATLDTYSQTKELKSSSSVISDFKLRKRRCIMGVSVVCKSKLNSKVTYISVPWIPGKRTAIEEFNVIYEYVNTLEGSSLNDICKKNKLNTKLVNFSLALVLYLRERQYDVNHIDAVNFIKSPLAKIFDKFRKFNLYVFDFFGLGHGKNTINTAPWKRILEEQWKLNPSKTLEFLIVGAHLQEVRSDAYSSSEWSEFDFAIATVVHFFSTMLGVPILYGQYISKVSRKQLLIEREALNIQKYNVPAPHSAKYEVE